MFDLFFGVLVKIAKTVFDFFGCFVKFAKSVGSAQALLVLSAVIASSVNMINIFIIAKVRESNRGRNDPYIGFASSNSFHSISIHF